mgnify:CR=1 FL=1
MKLITAIVKPPRLDDIKRALQEIGVAGMHAAPRSSPRQCKNDWYAPPPPRGLDRLWCDRIIVYVASPLADATRRNSTR